MLEDKELFMNAFRSVLVPMMGGVVLLLLTIFAFFAFIPLGLAMVVIDGGMIVTWIMYIAALDNKRAMVKELERRRSRGY
jgi:ABC-type transport system involved in cytochrome bd biosynthesis fused ATPase/permease subunit